MRITARLRLIARMARVALALMIVLPPHFLKNRRGDPSNTVRKFLVMASRAIGLDITVRGRPLDRNALFVANHSSWMDIVAIGAATGAAFVSKTEVAGWPLVGGLARVGGTIFIDRTDRRGAQEQARLLHDELARGRPAVLFPEGTTAGGGDLLPFRAPLFSAVVPPPPGIRVQPVAIDYGALRAEAAWPNAESFSTNAARLVSRRRRIPVTLHFLDPIDPAVTGDRKTLATISRDAIVRALDPVKAAS